MASSGHADKLSRALTILFAIVFLGETVTWRLAVGVAMILGGVLLTIPPPP